jgi:hypothetical protein
MKIKIIKDIGKHEEDDSREDDNNKKRKKINIERIRNEEKRKKMASGMRYHNNNQHISKNEHEMEEKWRGNIQKRKEVKTIMEKGNKQYGGENRVDEYKKGAQVRGIHTMQSIEELFLAPKSLQYALTTPLYVFPSLSNDYISLTSNNKRKFTPIQEDVPLSFLYAQLQSMHDCFVLDKRGGRTPISVNMEKRCVQCNQYGILDCYYYGFVLESNVCLEYAHKTFFDTRIDIAIHLLQSYSREQLPSKRFLLGICWFFEWSGRFTRFAKQVAKRADHLTGVVQDIYQHLRKQVEPYNKFIASPLL